MSLTKAQLIERNKALTTRVEELITANRPMSLELSQAQRENEVLKNALEGCREELLEMTTEKMAFEKFAKMNMELVIRLTDRSGDSHY